MQRCAIGTQQARNINRVPILKRHAPHCAHNGKCNLYKRKGGGRDSRGTRHAARVTRSATYDCSRSCATRRHVGENRENIASEILCARTRFCFYLFYEKRRNVRHYKMGLFLELDENGMWMNYNVEIEAFPHRLSQAQSVNANRFRVGNRYRATVARLRTQDLLLSSQITGDGTVRTLTTRHLLIRAGLHSADADISSMRPIACRFCLLTLLALRYFSLLRQLCDYVFLLT